MAVNEGSREASLKPSGEKGIAAFQKKILQPGLPDVGTGVKTLQPAKIQQSLGQVVGMLLPGVTHNELFFPHSHSGILGQISGNFHFLVKGLFQRLPGLPFLKESLASVGWRALSALATGKIIALAFGPAGTALFGQALNLFSIQAGIPSDALARAMVREGNAGSDAARQNAASTASVLLLLVFTLIAIVSLLLSHLTSWFEPFASVGNISSFFLAFFLAAAGSFTGSYFLIWKKTNLQALSVSFMALGGLAGLSISHWAGLGFFECLIGFLVGQAAGAFGLLVWKMTELPALFSNVSLDFSLAGRLLRFASALAASGAVSMISGYALVHWSMETMGAVSVGKWMAMNRLADTFTIPILAVANSILLPALAGLSGNPEGLRKFLKPVFRFSMRWLFPAILLLWLAYPMLMRLLFSSDFSVDSGLLPWQLAGDYFRGSTSVFAVLMLALGHTRFYFWLETASSLFMLAGTWMLYPKLGFAALFWMHAVRYFLYWLVIVLRYRRIFF